MSASPQPALVERFRRDLEDLTSSAPRRLGVAVSGGPDSLALLLLAAAACPGQIEAATVDHVLRTGSAEEAAGVAAVCAARGIPHAILRPDWSPPRANIQAEARAARYALLAQWSLERDLGFVATAHHVDDQAETLLMRLARGAGVAGLAGVRVTHASPGAGGDRSRVFIRPLLGWTRRELAGIVADAGLRPVDDPGNADERFDRTRARALLAATGWLKPARLAASASHLREAEAALAWSAAALFAERRGLDARGRLTVAADDLPRELQRRLLVQGLGAPEPVPGPKLSRLLDRLRQGEAGTLAGTKVTPGPPWTFEQAPPRRA